MPHVLVWDLETIPDVATMAAVQGISVKEVREALKIEFPKLPYHHIVCIGALVCSQNASGWEIESIGAPSIADRTEAELISSFIERIASLKPQLVTFNGSSFDLPVLRYRAMAHKINAQGLNVRGYYNRFTDDALDLCDVLASYDPRARVSLNLTCRAMGLRGKGSGISGVDVERYVASGRVKEVAEYCESDVVNTFRLWLRYEQFRGAIQHQQFESSESSLMNFIRNRADTKPHLQSLI